MEFDDEEDKPKEVTKTRRFAPGKSKPKPLDSAVTLSKIEHHVVDAKLPKVEPEVYTGSVKMEIGSKLNKEPETTEPELMEVDQIPLQEEEEEEEEDVVVREIDVFFNPSIEANTKLYVLQYPLRPSWRPYEMDQRCEQVRVNPSTSQTLTTTWKKPPTMDYAIGVLSGDKLHLNPVHAVAQLRPSFQCYSSKKKQPEAPEESVRTSEKLNKGVHASTDQKPNPEQNWVPLKYHGLQSEFCSKYLNGMMANGNSSIDFNMSSEVYINSLCHGGNSETKHSSKRVLTSLPIEERVKKLLCQGHPLFQYSVLKHYAPELSNEDFLRVIQQYAWLVQGLWTPKSELLKLEGPVKDFRNYVLMLFSKGSTINYSDIEATGHLREKRKTMLTVFAKERPLLCDWKFKEPTDVSFIKSYPEIAKEQASSFLESYGREAYVKDNPRRRKK
ncbi:DNA-directed RNA polymerase III subunit Rpc5 [Arabidopsis thaliana x Arabidopsis arenosa]|uniref:DNA-directed RNA polymerase III subunit Rpc5 n=1 Tax=Arabidopsis thaliana x Arabidopsis arenosa TaxID=1240361 RepID=A0A8T1ZL64_9BRAS|nr:DNA-directed RNA polymerase III subunit Rpc5 [Arabidopsis thaliana x Arabidopsis arenosa]